MIGLWWPEVGRYLDIARKASEERTTPLTSEGIVSGAGREESEISVKSSKHRGLVAAKWTPRTRCGKTIWASPQTGFWYLEEMALELLRLDRGPKGGAA